MHPTLQDAYSFTARVSPREIPSLCYNYVYSDRTGVIIGPTQLVHDPENTMLILHGISISYRLSELEVACMGCAYLLVVLSMHIYSTSYRRDRQPTGRVGPARHGALQLPLLAGR